MAERSLHSVGVHDAQGLDDLIVKNLGSCLLRCPFRRTRKLELGLTQRQPKLFTNGLYRENWEGAVFLRLREPLRHFWTRFDHRESLPESRRPRTSAHGREREFAPIPGSFSRGEGLATMGNSRDTPELALSAKSGPSQLTAFQARYDYRSCGTWPVRLAIAGGATHVR